MRNSKTNTLITMMEWDLSTVEAQCQCPSKKVHLGKNKSIMSSPQNIKIGECSFTTESLRMSIVTSCHVVCLYWANHCAVKLIHCKEFFGVDS